MNKDLDEVAGGQVRPGTQVEIVVKNEGNQGLDRWVGMVTEIDDDFLVLDGYYEHPKRKSRSRQEYELVLYSGDYGAHGDLEGIVDLVRDGRASVTIL